MFGIPEHVIKHELQDLPHARSRRHAGGDEIASFHGEILQRDAVAGGLDLFVQAADSRIAAHELVQGVGTLGQIVGKYELQIFSAYITESTSNAYKRTFESDAKFTEWLNNAVRHSYVKTDVKVGPEDHVVTLSTCVKSEDTRRFIALGKLVKIED